MYSTKSFLFSIVILVLGACKENKPKEDVNNAKLPKLTKLDTLKQTQFVISLESPIEENKNAIYAPAFLYAWDKVKTALKDPIVTDSFNSAAFKILNKSTAHQNTLTESEYTATIDVSGGAIVAKAFFNKTLPFKTQLEILAEPIIFNGTKVAAFGMYSYNEDIAKATQILYYLDDEHFILKLTPKDNQHEIILVKGIEQYKTFEEAIRLANALVEQGKKEQINSTLLWKYSLTKEDMFAIPVIRFNIETNYNDIQGQSFSTGNGKSHIISEAYQRTAFILNESGAVVESEALVVVDSASMAPEIIQPKKMIFNKPFLILIKRTDKANPYFVMKVANAELLKNNE